MLRLLKCILPSAPLKPFAALLRSSSLVDGCSLGVFPTVGFLQPLVGGAVPVAAAAGEADSSWLIRPVRTEYPFRLLPLASRRLASAVAPSVLDEDDDAAVAPKTTSVSASLLQRLGSQLW